MLLGGKMKKKTKDKILELIGYIGITAGIIGIIILLYKVISGS